MRETPRSTRIFILLRKKILTVPIPYHPPSKTHAKCTKTVLTPHQSPTLHTPSLPILYDLPSPSKHSSSNTTPPITSNHAKCVKSRQFMPIDAKYDTSFPPSSHPSYLAFHEKKHRPFNPQN